MENFKEETYEALQEYHKQPSDIELIGSKDGYITIEEFNKLSDFYYDSGYGYPEIPTDLFILFKDGSWMERRDYDGSEWWEHCSKPFIKDGVHLKITNELINTSYSILQEALIKKRS